MKYYFKNELKRALFSKGAFISFFITLGAFISAFMSYVNYDIGVAIYDVQNGKIDALDIFLNSRSSVILSVAFPLFATIIFADSYLQEKESGFTKFLYSRISIKKYVAIKVIVNSVSSALIAGGTSLLVFLSLVAAFGVSAPNEYSYTSNIQGPLNNLFNSANTRFLYGLIVVLLFTVAYLVTATLSLGISAWVKNRYLVLIAPFFYFIICGTIIERLGINRFFDFHLTRLISLQHSMTNLLNVVLYPLLIFIVGIFLFYMGVIVKNEKDL